jgi:hypothetical protein
MKRWALSLAPPRVASLHGPYPWNRLPTFMRSRLFSLAVATASLATIALELLLTRIYSVTMYYHFAFMVISLALLGLAISGVATYLVPRLFRHERAPLIAALCMLLFGVSTVWALGVAVHNPISLHNWDASLSRLLKLYFAASLPFVCSGFALTLAIATARERIGTIYAFDLFGAALGCVLIIPIISRLGGPGAILFAGATGAVAAALFALASERRAVRALSAGAFLVCAVLVGLAVTEQSGHRFGIVRNPEKFLGQRPLLFERWNAFSQITVTPAGDADHRWIFIDADAATRMWSGAIQQDNWSAPRRIAEVRVASLVYALRHDGTALIIGPGGGTDVTSALHWGVPRVVGVEVNPLIVEDVMRGEFADFSGNLYRNPRVEVMVDEGRSYVRRTGERFASIQATLVDTWAASSSGAFTLSENNLYTAEAFGEFLDHLDDHGILAVTRWYNIDRPSEFLRLVALGRLALERRGVPPGELARHFILATDGERRGTLLLGRSAFSPEDIRRIATEAMSGHLRLLFAPEHMEGPLGPPTTTNDRNTRDEDPLLAGFLRAPDATAFLSALPYNAAATEDDRPFFFYTLKRQQAGSLLGQLTTLDRNNLGVAILLVLLLVSLGLTTLFVILPLVLFRRDALREARRPKLRVLGYFLCLGLGFILVELGFMQKFVLFLGHPIYALAVVLAMLLASSGAGSALSAWGVARWRARGFVLRVVPVLASVLGIYALALTPLFHALIGLVLPLRIALAALLVLVPGLLMGTLLPTGVRTANALGPDLVAWAWGLNGAASVVGSILAIFLSMNFGFTTALGAGVAIYLLGMATLPRITEAAVEGSSSIAA